MVVLLPSLGSARKARFLARAYGQKARLGSARSLFQKARFVKILEKQALSKLYQNGTWKI